MTLFGYCMFYIAVDLYIMLHIMPLVTGIIQGIIWSFSVCTCGSSYGLSSWICLQTFCHNEHIHRVSRQCEISCVPVEAMDERKLCYKYCTCGTSCVWEYAWTRLACWHTSENIFKWAKNNCWEKIFHTLLQIGHFLAFVESSVRCVCRCLERLLLVA